MCNNSFLIDTIMIFNTIRPLILSGPSGCGKTTLISHLLSTYPLNFELSISHTTRSPRPNEIDSLHYYFIQNKLFQAMIKNGDFLEYEEVHGKFYGTSKNEILRIIDKKRKIPVLDIDIKGAMNIYNNCKIFKANYLFITTKDIKTLEKRLVDRKTETVETIKIRVKNAKDEIKKAALANIYREDDYIYNEDLEVAKGNLMKKIIELYPEILQKY